MFFLLFFFIIIPLAEIFVFIQVSNYISVLYIIAMVIVTAIIGTSLLRWQGRGVLARTQEALNKGELPVDSVIDGVFLLIAGALLLTPGFITDTVGFLLFVPFLRRAIAKSAFRYFASRGKMDVNVYSSNAHNDNNVIDAEFTEVKRDSRDDSHDGKIDPENPWKR